MRLLSEQEKDKQLSQKERYRHKTNSARAMSAAVGVISTFQTAIKIETARKEKQLGKFEECVCQSLLRSSNSSLTPALAFISVENTL